MINILYLIPSLKNSGGMEKVLSDKVNFLSRLDQYRIFIVTTEMDDNETSFFFLDNRIKIVNFKIFFNKFYNDNIFSKLYKTLRLLDIYKNLLIKFISDYNIDICISMGGKEIEFLGSLELDCKKIYECHFDRSFKSKFFEINGKNNIFWRFLGYLRDYQHFKYAEKFDCMVVLSKAAYNDWHTVDTNLKIIANPTLIECSENSFILNNYKRVIAIGHLEKVKGFDLLVESWAIVNKNHPEWKLDIYGQGSQLNYIQQQINDLHLAHCINLKGITRQVENELRSSNFYVMSSRSEGLPMVLIESISCGLPIVSFDCDSGPREIIQSNDCGILVKNGDIRELSLAIQNMIENPTLRKNMSDNALTKAKFYQINNIMSLWLEVFDEIISN